LNRYPDPQANDLKQALRTEFLISDKHELIFGNGSDELIQMLALAIAKPDACVLMVTPSFSMYKLISEFIGVHVVEVPLTKTFSLQVDKICEAINDNKPSITFLACPNNPTGTLWPIEDVEKIIQQTQGLVVIDEAYAPFSSFSMTPLVDKYSNALMLRTFSKMGLAGLRFGWMAGAEKWLNELNKLRLPYNINTLTQASIQFALENMSVFNDQAKQICEQREQLFLAMQGIDELQVFPSEANFLLFKMRQSSADKVFASLLEQKVMIKNVANNKLLKNCLRVTVGTESENEIFINALKRSIR
ncbi:MAG: histidinol-phosphate transaminase, partial [Gammaproteobacteria bacterium]